MSQITDRTDTGSRGLRLFQVCENLNGYRSRFLEATTITDQAAYFQTFFLCYPASPNPPSCHCNTSSEAIYSILGLLLRPLAIADDYADATKIAALRG